MPILYIVQYTPFKQQKKNQLPITIQLCNSNDTQLSLSRFLFERNKQTTTTTAIIHLSHHPFFQLRAKQCTDEEVLKEKRDCSLAILSLARSAGLL